ncbi:60 kDa jasmonate-induced protein isoform X1 [Triticum aestivum]|uniref:DUF6598 domain-containing protein n=3 Tax=Triticum TaxID=4564 RepID=A0A9R1QZZ0_TRITD|nr:60 kDa jasmonate-induced protein-like isoform X1 [Triticum aestivum]VAH86703.1 unnamed protein product [Triticum turgidum subsp. durum]
MSLDLNIGWKDREREKIGLNARCSPSMQDYSSYGKELVEVLSVRYKGQGDPSCTIIVYDGKRGQIIYTQSGQGDMRVSHEHSNSGTQNGSNDRRLLLTGPYRVISMDGCVLIEYNIDDHCHAKILLDIDDPSTKHDEAVTAELGCTCDNHPKAVVTYALLSNAVEAIVEVKLHQRRDNTFYGTIIAYSYLGDVVLFETDNEKTLIGSSQEPTIIPLARSVLAVPLDSSLQIEVDLWNHSNGKIVKGLVSCQAHLNSNHVVHLDGENGQVDVKITWSD